MVEGAPLLREYTGDGIEGSNPFLSAILSLTAVSLRSTPPRGRPYRRSRACAPGSELETSYRTLRHFLTSRCRPSGFAPVGTSHKLARLRHTTPISLYSAILPPITASSSGDAENRAIAPHAARSLAAKAPGDVPTCREKAMLKELTEP